MSNFNRIKLSGLVCAGILSALLFTHTAWMNTASAEGATQSKNTPLIMGIFPRHVSHVFARGEIHKEHGKPCGIAKRQNRRLPRRPGGNRPQHAENRSLKPGTLFARLGLKSQAETSFFAAKLV